MNLPAPPGRMGGQYPGDGLADVTTLRASDARGTHEVCDATPHDAPASERSKR